MKLNNRYYDWTIDGGGLAIVTEEHPGGSTSTSFVKEEAEIQTTDTVYSGAVKYTTTERKSGFFDNLVTGILKSGGPSWYENMNENFDRVIRPELLEQAKARISEHRYT